MPVVWLGYDAVNAELKKILNVRIYNKQVVLKFYGTETVEEAEKLKDLYLFVPKEDAIKLQNGSYFVDDVIGCEVVTEEQVHIGMITDLLSLPMNDVWVVKKDEKEILIPAVKAIIRLVDVEHKRVTVHSLDGLFD